MGCAMARTPLLSSLRRLALEHRLSLTHGVPLDVIRARRAHAAERAAGAMTRRELLAGAIAATTTLALPRPARARRSDAEIAIVGAGIAGLTTALTLADHGVAAQVYEASARVGGRMFTNAGNFWRDGQVSEWGGELIDSGHRTIRRLARRFRLDLVDLPRSEPRDAEETYFFAGQYYPKQQADLDFAPVFAAVAADAEAAGYPTTHDASTPAGRALDAMSVYDWIESRVPGGHDAPFGQLLDVAYATEYGADTADQSALNLVYLLAFQPARNSFADFGESDERFHIAGGNQQLPAAIAAELGVGETIQLGMRLVRIARDGGGGRYALTFERRGGTTEISADVVVLALPFAVLRELDYAGAGFDALKDEAIQELGRGHSAKLQLQFRRRLWNEPGPWPGLSNGSTYADTGYQGSWDVTRGQDGTSGILTQFLGGSAVDPLVIKGGFGTSSARSVRRAARTGLAQLEPVFPGSTALWNGKATLSVPHASPFFNCSYSYWRVGQYQRFAGYEGAPQDRVLFAGEHTSIDFQGFMEGGAAEGQRAAREVLHLLRRG